MPVFFDRSSAARFALLAVCCLPTAVGNLLSVGLAAEPKERGVHDRETYDRLVVPFFRQHCLGCHGPDDPQDDLRLDQLSPDFLTTRSAAHWIEVMDRMNLGEMPPDGEPRPNIEQTTAITGWIARELREADRRRRSSGGRAVLRRMNRAEYANTIRDLLGMQFLPGESPLNWLPPDGTAEGFDRISLALTLDPSLLERYFQVASRIADRALVEGPPPFPTETMRLEMEDIAKNRAIDYLCTKPGIECREQDIELMEGSTRSFGVMKYPDTYDEIPVAGLYRIRVRAWGQSAADGEPVVMRVQQQHPQDDQRLLIETEVTDKPKVYEIVIPRDPKCGEYSVEIVNRTGFQVTSRVGSEIRREQKTAGENGDYEQVIRLQSRQQMEALTWGKPRPESADRSKLRKLFVDWIECEGPLYDQWPPKSHELVLHFDEKEVTDPERIPMIFERFMSRAFRRPASPEEVAAVTRLVREELKLGADFNEAIGTGLTAVLCSPKFLYLSEPAPETTTADTEPRPLDNWEIASRLSYLIWSSMPDERLFDLAKAGQLRNREVLLTELDRMLADPKAVGFVNGFGASWLRTDEFLNFPPDSRLYRDYSPELGEAMVGQALRFFEEVLRTDEPLTVFLDSNWTMLNEPLAEFYGIDGVKGDEFRRVELSPESPRGGILGMAGVALLGSDGTRTKPVHRGVYVREVLFNDPPDPPPPNAGEVEPNIKGENLTVRERLIQHQQIASCAACHRGIDGYGLALENFNVVGQWRTRQDGENFRAKKAPAIDPSGTLPNGESFETFDEFKSLLVAQRQRFARGVTEKLVIYALGRPIEPSDRAMLDRLVTDLLTDEFTFRTLLRGIVTSDAFLTK